MSKAFIEGVAKEFKTLLRERIKINRSGKVLFDNKELGEGALNRLINAVPKPEADRLKQTYGAEHFSDNSHDGELVAAVKRAYTSVNVTSVLFNDSIKSPLSEILYVQNVFDLKNSFLYDKVHDRAYGYDFEYINKHLGTILGKGREDWVARHSIHCKLLYLPEQKDRIFKDPDDGHMTFNYWEEPEWKKDWQPAVETKCPIEIEEYFSCLAADAESLHYLKAWVRDAVFSRAEPILIFHGMPGTGKTFFAKHFLSRFFHKNDYHMSPAIDFGEDKFQSELTECRIFHCEEVNLTDNGRDFLKMLHNGEASIKRKFQDIKRPEKVWASIVLTTNPKTSTRKLRLEYSDRKFFVPNLHEAPLLKSMGKKKIDELAEKMNDPEYVRRAANYFYTNFAPGESQKFPKTLKFKDLCIASYPYYFRRFIDICKKTEEFTHKDFKKNFHRFTDPQDLEEQIQHYEQNFNERLVDIVHGDLGAWTAKSHIYKPAPAYTNGNGAHPPVPKAVVKPVEKKREVEGEPLLA